MPPEQFIWISRWQEFQHYKPNRERGPAWVKMYTAQLADAGYLELNSKQRSVLHDLRMLFATLRGQLPNDTRMLSGLIYQRVTNQTLERLSQAGYLEVVSRETLEHRLEKLYSGSRAEVEVEKEVEQPPNPNPAVDAPENGRQLVEDVLAGRTPLIKDLPF